MEIISSSSKFNIRHQGPQPYDRLLQQRSKDTSLVLTWVHRTSGYARCVYPGVNLGFLESMGTLTPKQLLNINTCQGFRSYKMKFSVRNTTFLTRNIKMRFCNFLIFVALFENVAATLKMYGRYLYLGQTTEQKSETSFNPEYMAIKYDFKYRERQISIFGEGKGFRNISSLL